MSTADRLPAPPRAPRRPTVLRHGDDERTDDWFWLRERDDPDVREYLEAENAYTTAGLEHTEPVQQRVFADIKARVQETDASAVVQRGDWEYFTRTIEGREYAVHCRRPAGTAAAPDPVAAPATTDGEMIVLDENVLAADVEYFVLRGFALSPAQRLFAYAVDVSGGELATLRFRDLETGTDLPDEIDGVYYGLLVGERRVHLLLRPDRRRDPSVPGVAPRAR